MLVNAMIYESEENRAKVKKALRQDRVVGLDEGTIFCMNQIPDQIARLVLEFLG